MGSDHGQSSGTAIVFESASPRRTGLEKFHFAWQNEDLSHDSLKVCLMPLRFAVACLALLMALPCPAGIPGKQSDWHGFTRRDFTHDGRQCIVVSPKKAAEGNPWVWRARFFGHEPQADIALLKLGFHIAYCDVSNLFGSPTAVKHWDSFYERATREFGFAKKPALEGMSRGGLIIYNWAAANPDKVACLYGDAPVCDFKSWPGGKGKGKGGGGAWADCLKAYGFTEVEAMAFRGNPVDNLKPLAQAKIPILHVVGAVDVVVPVAENTALIEARYKELGGDITVISKPGIGHHPHALKDPKPIVDFILKHASKTEDDKAKATINPKTTFHQGRSLQDWEDCLQHENNYVRWITVARLDGEGPCHSYFVPHLLDLTADRDSRVAGHAIGALGQLSQHAEMTVPILREIASSSQHPNQKAAIAALGLLAFESPAKNGALLRKMLDSEDVSSRILAARGLWKLEGRSEHLGVILDNTACIQNKCRQRGAVLSLSHFAAQEESFVPALEKFVDQNTDRPRHEAEQKIAADIKSRAVPLIAARRARQSDTK